MQRNLAHLDQTYNGKSYYAEPEKASTSCEGCAFAAERDGVYHCKVPAAADAHFKEDCYYEQIVWKEVSAPMLKKVQEEEPKFTVEQVLAATGKHCDEKGPVFISFNETIPTAVAWIKQYLTQQQDPDYLLYLQLKAKYDQA